MTNNTREGLLMKKTMILAIILSALIGTSVFAQSTDNATATVDAVVMANLVLSNTASVNFGNLASTSNPVIDPKGVSHTDVGAGAQVGTFTLTGPPTTNITVTFDANATLGDGGFETLTFTPDLEGHATTQGSATDVTSGSTVATNGSGDFLFWLGGSLGSLIGQASGTYATNAGNGSGDWTLTVEYN